MPGERIAVIGGGLMGAGIAQTFAAAGHSVIVHEPVAAVRETVLSRIADGLRALGADAGGARHVSVVDDLAGAVRQADYVTEAVPERLHLKRQVFSELVTHAPAHAMLASNTSVIPIGQIVAGLATAERIVGTHWWNPAPLIPLVEVVQAKASDDTVARCMALLRSIGKVPAHVRKDVPGFVANRLQHALWREAIAMVADGICDAQTVDDCVKNSFGMRLAVLGPLENADLVGLDLTLDIHRTIIPALDRHDGPHEFLKAQVDAGRLGFKSGTGFRSWTEAQMSALREQLTQHLVAARTARQ
ncbi:MAG TPA: 3-hydroxyacyl-CoA dehydrogenase family protein [Povalibacter sp.]|uniref:3-hydroxyacyl-CoA dehydrogenase family protein n=1 Tax=Povalibacter sp. TaxID=1962978 RepID=UPI002C569DF6|nr:3-hydroxyacyl-CoA dehydrogenase family protein [Povalibacter sp.]HMN43806.1 3-hydroxyacyl-CoA dehydrogenase family protein [Povalibacter sp.]